MMRFVLAAALFMLALPTFALSPGEAKTIYSADTKKVDAGDLSFDWREFRLAAAQGGTGYFDWHPVRAQCMKQLNSGDLEGALKSANEIIHHNMAEPEGHLLALVVFQKQGRTEDAAFQHKVVDAYVQSILASGNGKSSATAFFVVNEGEEYFYLNILMGVGLPELQSLIVKDGHSYDLLKVKDRDGKEQEIWFNVDTSMDAMRDELGEGKKKK
jgi:Domain of unknown function (DUF4919)